MKHDDNLYRKKDSSYKSKYVEKNSRKGIDSKKLAYNFQPGFNPINPVFLPLAKTPLKVGGGNYQPLPKNKALIPGPAIYKY